LQNRTRITIISELMRGKTGFHPVCRALCACQCGGSCSVVAVVPLGGVFGCPWADVMATPCLRAGYGSVQGRPCVCMGGQEAATLRMLGVRRGGCCMFLVGGLVKVQKGSKHGEWLLSRCCSRPCGHNDYSSRGWFQTGTCPSGRTRGDSDSSRVQSESRSCNWTSR
jgi:hypothetical protein